MPRSVCMLSARVGRETPCWFNCGTFCKRRIVGHKAPSSFVLPSDLGNLAAWFRYGAGITIAGQGVSQWDDASGNGRHLKQGTDGARPALQSDGSILFNGSDERLKCDAFTFSQPETVYILGKQVTWTNTDYWFDGNTADSGAVYQSATTPRIRQYAGANGTENAGLAVDTYAVICAVFNGAASVLQINNNSPVTSNPGANNMGGFNLGSGGGGSFFGNIQVKEVILFAAAHDAATRKVMINYLGFVGGLGL